MSKNHDPPVDKFGKKCPLRAQARKAFAQNVLIF
jgi:hypothetical protein